MISIATATTVRQANITRLIFSEDSRNKNPLRMETKLMVNENDTVLNMDIKEKALDGYLSMQKAAWRVSTAARPRPSEQRMK